MTTKIVYEKMNVYLPLLSLRKCLRYFCPLACYFHYINFTITYLLPCSRYLNAILTTKMQNVRYLVLYTLLILKAHLEPLHLLVDK
jgi:hypothetical protein